MPQLMEESTVSLYSKIQPAASRILFHCFDFFRIYTIIQFLADRYADQVFNEVGRYADRPTLDADHYPDTSAPIMLGSALAAITVKTINVIYSKKYESYLAAQDFVYALFSSSLLFFVGDLFSSSGYMPSLSIFQFVMISLIGVFAMMAIFLKLTTPLSSDKMIFSRNPQSQIIYFDEYATAFPHPSKTERVLNAVGSVGHIASLSTFFWVLNHEIQNGVAPLAIWQKVMLGLSAAGLGVFGAFTVTDHPKYYLSFLMAVMFLNSAAIAYAGISALACFANCQNYHAAYVIAPGIFVALLNGLFSASHIQYDFENTHAANKNIEEMFVKISDKAASIFHRCQRCCKPEVVEEVEKRELMEVV